MKATAILHEEHRWILRLVDCLDRVVQGVRETDELDDEAAFELLDLFESFSDKRHQEKEELLFPRLRILANAKEAKLIRKLLEEHESDQGQMLHMRSSLHGAIQGDPVGRREFVRRAAEYVTLQRRHMAKENAVMLPLAERLLTAADDREILSGFERIEARGAESVVSFRRIVALCERLGVPCPEQP